MAANSSGTATASLQVRHEKQWKNVDKESDLPKRVSDLLLSENLVVLSGLGTSLCLLNPDGKTPRAPTMGKLWEETAKEEKELDAIKKQVHYTPANGQENIEALLSHCQL